MAKPTSLIAQALRLVGFAMIFFEVQTNYA